MLRLGDAWGQLDHLGLRCELAIHGDTDAIGDVDMPCNSGYAPCAHCHKFGCARRDRGFTYDRRARRAQVTGKRPNAMITPG